VELFDKEKSVKKIVITFGLISGVISSTQMAVIVPFVEQIGWDRAVYFGYTAIVLSFMLVFFGIKRYRDNVGHGQVSFVKAFQVGILITLVSCVFYVVTWQVLYFTVYHDFMDKYSAHMLAEAKSSGASEAELQKQTAEMAKFKEMYENPLINAAYTFLEPFPVGLVVTLVSAGVLRKKDVGRANSPTAVTA
jgi:amino acid transporter